MPTPPPPTDGVPVAPNPGPGRVLGPRPPWEMAPVGDEDLPEAVWEQVAQQWHDGLLTEQDEREFAVLRQARDLWLARQREVLEDAAATREQVRAAGALARAAQVGPAPVGDDVSAAATADVDRPAGGSADASIEGLTEALAGDLRWLREHSRRQALAFLAEAQVLARAAGRVPREPGDERGASAWTSFLREVAVARRCSDVAASTDVRRALLLQHTMPKVRAALQQGRLPVPQAQALLRAGQVCTDPAFIADSADGGHSALQAVDALADLTAADRCWSVPRLQREADRAVLRADADAAAARTARTAAERGVRLRTRTTRTETAPEDTAELVLDGPALPLAQAQAALDTDARALQLWLRQHGDRRPLDALRFDLAVHRLLGHHAPAHTAQQADLTAQPGDSTRPARGTAGSGAGKDTPDAPGRPSGPGAAADARVTTAGELWAAFCHARGASADKPTPAPTQQAASASPVPDVPDVLPDPTSPRWWTDRRFTRPVQLQPLVPVTTLLGLTHEPGWVPGLGWISAPTIRQLLPIAELRQICQDPDTGQVIDLAERPLRPAPTLTDTHAALRTMCTQPFTITDTTWRTEPHYRPSPVLSTFVRLRDSHDDGPTGTTIPATRAELDHQQPYDHTHPDTGGPTAAWNLAARGTRTHQLKHHGWTPTRTATTTRWTSPHGQTTHTPHWHQPPTPLPPAARLPDPHALHTLETELLRPTDHDDPAPF